MTTVLLPGRVHGRVAIQRAGGRRYAHTLQPPHVLRAGYGTAAWDRETVRPVQLRCGKVLQVRGDNDAGAGLDGGGEDVAVAGIGEFEGWQ